MNFLENNENPKVYINNIIDVMLSSINPTIIYVVTNNAKISASSKNGKVFIEDIEATGAALRLSSINGDITVVKQE